MAIFRKIHTTFWSDSFISDLDKDKKLFYLYLLTNERSSQCGIYEITKKQISYDLGYSIDTVSIMLNFFIKANKIRYNEATKEIVIKNWLKYNGSDSPKIQSCINKELAKVKDTLLIQYLYSIDTHPQQEEEQEEEPEKEKSKKILLSKINISDFPEINHEFYEIAISFYELFKSNLIEAGASTTTLEKANLKWIDEIRLMSEIDKVTTQDFRDIYAFLKIDTFWKQNILSTKKLREKYPQLKLKIHAAKQQFTGSTKKTGNRVTEEYERNILERLRG